MDPDDRQRLIARFTAYLQDMDDGIAQSKGESAHEVPDLFSLLAELAALKNEVKLESRQVKTALDEFRQLFDTLRQANTRLDGELARRRERETRERRDQERDWLLELLELRDRQQAGLDQLRGYRPGWLARRGGASDYMQRIADGQAMILRRLDETLARRGVQPLGALGQRFDPVTMHAAETRHDAGQAPGQVLGETRAGYLRDGQLLRAAEVIVNKPPDAAPKANPKAELNPAQEP